MCRGFVHWRIPDERHRRSELQTPNILSISSVQHPRPTFYQLLRVPVSFKSISDGVEYFHIVLGIKHKNLWGAVGISRLPNLMHKALKHNSLIDLILDYNKCYAGYFHKLVNVSIGLPFSHNRVSETALQWYFVKCSLDNDSGTWRSYTERCNRYSKDCAFIATYYEATGYFPPWCDKAYRNGEGNAKSR